MGGEQSHETDDSGDGHGPGRKQTRAGQKRQPGPAGRDAELAGLSFAQKQDIELPNIKPDEEQAGEKTRGKHCQLGLAPALETTHARDRAVGGWLPRLPLL